MRKNRFGETAEAQAFAVAISEYSLAKAGGCSEDVLGRDNLLKKMIVAFRAEVRKANDVPRFPGDENMVFFTASDAVKKVETAFRAECLKAEVEVGVQLRPAKMDTVFCAMLGMEDFLD